MKYILILCAIIFICFLIKNKYSKDFFENKNQDLIYLNFKYDNEFIEKNKFIFDFYLFNECFMNGQYFNFLEIDPEISSLYIVGKETKLEDDKNFKFENKYYEVKCIFTIKNPEPNKYELWNACSPILSRKQGYFQNLFKYFLTTIDFFKSEIILYVRRDEPEKMKNYEKIGFKYESKTDEDENYKMRYIH